MYQSIECGAVPRAAAPLAARRSSNRGVLRAIVAVFAVSAFCGSLISGGAPSRAHDVDATTALTADVRSSEAGFFTDEEQLVVDVLLGSSAPDFHLNCSSTTFAYCGSASCLSPADGANTTTCGCRAYGEQHGSLTISAESAFLVRSATFRRVVMEANAFGNGTTATAATAMCDAIRSNSLLAEAGFAAADSISLSLVRHGRRRRTTPHAAACMAGPCVSRTWGGGCDSVCACVAIGASVAGESCVGNGNFLSNVFSTGGAQEVWNVVQSMDAWVSAMAALPADTPNFGSPCANCTVSPES